MIKEIFQDAMRLICTNKVTSLSIVFVLFLFNFDDAIYQIPFLYIPYLRLIDFVLHFGFYHFVFYVIFLSVLYYVWFLKTTVGNIRHHFSSIPVFLLFSMLSFFANWMQACFSALELYYVSEYLLRLFGLSSYHSDMVKLYFSVGEMRRTLFAWTTVHVGIVLFILSPIFLRVALAMPALVSGNAESRFSFVRLGAGYGWPMPLTVSIFALPVWLALNVGPKYYTIEILGLFSESRYGAFFMIGYGLLNSLLTSCVMLFTMAVIAAAYNLSVRATAGEGKMSFASS